MRTTTRTVIPWNGRVTLDNRGNSADTFAERYVINVLLDNTAAPAGPPTGDRGDRLDAQHLG